MSTLFIHQVDCQKDKKALSATQCNKSATNPQNSPQNITWCGYYTYNCILRLIQDDEDGLKKIYVLVQVKGEWL